MTSPELELLAIALYESFARAAGGVQWQALSSVDRFYWRKSAIEMQLECAQQMRDHSLGELMYPNPGTTNFQP